MDNEQTNKRLANPLFAVLCSRTPGDRMRLGQWYIGFGFFLILCGIAGFASNPAGAKTALISGGSFGTLSALWGRGMVKREGLLFCMGALVTTLLLCAAFTWRSVVTWQAVAEGQPKRFAATLISLMLLASLLSLFRLLAHLKARSSGKDLA